MSSLTISSVVSCRCSLQVLRLALQEDGKRAFTASMARALKDALLCVLRCRAPQALTWHRKVVASMEALGAGEAAEAEMRRAERQVCLLRRKLLLHSVVQQDCVAACHIHHCCHLPHVAAMSQS